MMRAMIHLKLISNKGRCPVRVHKSSPTCSSLEHLRVVCSAPILCNIHSKAILRCNNFTFFTCSITMYHFTCRQFCKQLCKQCYDPPLRTAEQSFDFFNGLESMDTETRLGLSTSMLSKTFTILEKYCQLFEMTY